MTRNKLHRAVAQATGDDFDLVMSRGFSLVDDASALHDEDWDSLIADWDRARAESNHVSTRQDCLSRVSLRPSFSSFSIKSMRHTGLRARRSVHSAR